MSKLIDEAISKDAGITLPVYITDGVSLLIEKATKNDKYLNDYEGVVYDICWMFAMEVRRRKFTQKSSVVEFTTIVTGVGRKRNHLFVGVVGPKGLFDTTPVVTIMLPDEEKKCYKKQLCI